MKYCIPSRPLFTIFKLIIKLSLQDKHIITFESQLKTANFIYLSYSILAICNNEKNIAQL